jgi:hypothetical protein
LRGGNALAEHPRPWLDLVGLARQRRQALDLLRVGDQYLPAELFQRVVHDQFRAGRRRPKTDAAPLAGRLGPAIWVDPCSSVPYAARDGH